MFAVSQWKCGLVTIVSMSAWLTSSPTSPSLLFDFGKRFRKRDDKWICGTSRRYYSQKSTASRRMAAPMVEHMKG